MPMLKLIYKDLLLPFRSSSYLWAFVINNILLVFVLSMAIPLEFIRETAIGIFWAVMFINASQFTLKAVEDEFEDEAIFSLLTSRLTHTHLAISKIISTTLYLMASSMVNLLAIAVLFRLQKIPPASFFVILPIGILGIATVGIFISLISIRLRFKNLSFYILSIPLYIPFFVACVQGSGNFRVEWLLLLLFLISMYTFILIYFMEKEI